jgi:hypothetical protein
MKITHRRKWFLYTGFFTVIYAFFVVLALILQIPWLTPILVLLFGSGIAIPIYFRYRYRHSSKAEKRRMVSQKALNSYYYNRWYTPADSTQLENEATKLKRKKLR